MKPGRRQPTTQEVHGYPEYHGYDAQPAYEDRHAHTDLPWYNPKSWSKKVWIGVIVLVIIIIVVIAVPVAVTQSKNNSYPDYSEVAYSLAETCECNWI